MSSLLQNIQSKPVTIPEKPHGENQETPVIAEKKQDIKQDSETQKIVKEESPSKGYFSKKTILASLAGLAVLGGSVWAVKKYSSKSAVHTTQKLTPEEIKGKIDETKARIAELKEIISSNYLSRKKHLIEELNNFGEFDYRVPFENVKELRNKISSLEKGTGSGIENSTKIISENKQIIRSKSEKLASDERWQELNLLRERLVKILNDDTCTAEQKNIANEKIPLVNDLLINMVYPEEAAKYKGIYGLTDTQTYELVNTEFAALDDFMKEFDRIKDKEIPFSFDTMDKRFSHNGSLSEQDLFPEETAIINSNEKRIKEINTELKAAKDLCEKYAERIKLLAGDFRKMSEVQELKSLNKQIKVFMQSLNESAV